MPWTCRSGKAVTRRVPSSAAKVTWEAVPLPRQSRNSTGRHTGRDQKGSVTTMPATIHRLPRPIACPVCVDPSCVHRRQRPSGPTG
jgi:hypothetical protein